MQSFFFLAFLLPVALASVQISNNNVLEVEVFEKNTTVCADEAKNRNCAVVTLRCLTGPQEDGFEVEISPLNEAQTPPDHRTTSIGHLLREQNEDNSRDIRANGKPETLPNGTVIFKFSGKMVDLVRQDSNRKCGGGLFQKNCSQVHQATTIFDLLTPVPQSKTRLVWIAHIHVQLRCLISPTNPKDADTLPNVANVSLGYCEKFNHTIEFFPIPIPQACQIKINLASDITGQGYGYSLQKCFLSLPGQQSIPLITNGRTQKSARAEVTARSADGGSGLVYQLTVDGITPAQAATGALNCEAARCRSSVVGSAEYSQCVQGFLPSDFAAATGRGPSPVLNTAGMAGTRMRGDVKLYIPRPTVGRSSPANFMECIANV